jgi:membrane protein implicated in regulation of membrane protease activity
MDRLSIILSMLTGAVLTGALAIAAFTLGYYNWWAIGGAAIIGFVLAWPAAYVISRRIKREDPSWEPPQPVHKDAPIPPRDAPEV